jgi:hypothetical protein
MVGTSILGSRNWEGFSIRSSWVPTARTRRTGAVPVEEKPKIHCWLVVEPYPSEKYEFVSWDDYSQYMEKWKN